MDATTLRLLWRLTLAVTTLAFLVVGAVLGVELPFGRAGRGLTVLGILTSAVAVVLLAASLARRRQPAGALAAFAPEVLFGKSRGLVAGSLARLGAAMHRRRRGQRVRRVELAAREAAAENDRLAPEGIKQSADALFRLVYLARDARDPARLATLLGPELMLVWERALDVYSAPGGHRRAEVLGDVQIDLVGLTRTPEERETVIVLIEAELAVRVKDPHGARASPRDGPQIVRRLCQYWTLALCDGLWIAQAIEERAEGDRHLTEPIMAQPGAR